jgi:transcriptional regulator with XRE-family HTH domain
MWGMRLKVTLGANIRRLRKAAGLSQEALSAEVGIDMRYLGGIERGQENPTIEIIEGIAKELGVHVSTLVTDGRSKT